MANAATHRLTFFGVTKAACSCGEVFRVEKDKAACLSPGRCQDALLDQFLEHERREHVG